MSAVLFKLTGNATVHGIRSPCGTYFFSVYDFINAVCEKTGKYPFAVFASLVAEDIRLNVKPKLVHKMNSNVYYQLDPIKKRRPTPVMTLIALRALVDALGSRAKVNPSREYEDLYARFMNGDNSVIEEVHKKPFFAAPVHKAPVQQPVLPPEPVLEAIGAKRMRDQEEVLFNLELQERQMAINERQIALQERILTLREKTLALQTIS